jgi:hypothetical protein
MFEAFNQVQEGQVTGTGLGLFGVRQRAEGLNGTCGARHNTASPTGTGTVIWFAIPYMPDQTIDSARGLSRINTQQGRSHSFDLTTMGAPFVEPFGSESPTRTRKLSLVAVNPLQLELTVAAPSDLAKRTEDYIRSKGLTVMVVDDTPTVRKLMERLLRKMGFAEVTCYENGSKGLDAMMAGQVDIVFSDVQMPIMTGPEVRFLVQLPCRARLFSFSCMCRADGKSLQTVGGQRAELRLTHAPAADCRRHRERRPGRQGRRDR